jgi:hypothetical protein
VSPRFGKQADTAAWLQRLAPSCFPKDAAVP